MTTATATRHPVTAPVRSLKFHATLGDVSGTATVFESGQVFFVAEDSTDVVLCTDYEVVYVLVLGGRFDILSA